jgi:DNA polymerase-3 subunit epsilon
MREIVLDTETTGLDPAKGDRLLEIGAIEIVDLVATGATFHALINPEREVSEEAYRTHGHSSLSLQECPLFAEIAQGLLAFIANDPLVIHNAEFDMKFLNAELLAAGYPSISPERIVDTLALARRKHPGASNGLDALCDRYRIDRSRRTKHGALLDAQLLVEVYTELSGGRQKSLALASEAEALPPAMHAAARKKRDASLPPRFGALEILNHLAHIKSLGENAVWFQYRDRDADPDGR